MTHYDTLGVPPDASAARIRASYLALARRLHPDSLVGRPSHEIERASARFRAVTQAWQVLGDPDSRQAYDRTLARSAPTPPAPSAPRPTDRPAPPPSARRSPGYVVEEDDEVDVTPGGCLSLAFVLGGLALLLLLAVVLLLIGFVQSPTDAGPRDAPVPSTVSTPEIDRGQCVRVRPALTLVSCDGPSDGRVVSIVDAASSCPADLLQVLYDSRFWVCVRTPA